MIARVVDNWQRLAMALVFLVFLTSWGLNSCSRRAAERATVAATAAGITNDEGANAAIDTQRVALDVNLNERAIDAQTLENRNAIFATEGASQAIPSDVAAAGRRALCLRPTYRAGPACQQLRDTDPD